MNEPEFNERSVIQEVLSGRTEAYAALVRRHQDRVYSLCLSLMKNPTEAEDAAQEVFLKAYRNLGDFRLESAFSTWLYRIGYRHCLDLLRAGKRRRTEPLESVENTAQAPAAPGFRETEDLLAGLSEDQRQVLILRELQGFSYEEIAGTMGLSLDAVKARLRRARAALQESARHFLSSPNVLPIEEKS